MGVESFTFISSLRFSGSARRLFKQVSRFDTSTT